jgi:hypothetical protein
MVVTLCDDGKGVRVTFATLNLLYELLEMFVDEGVSEPSQWPKVNQLTLTKSAGWPLVKVR